MEIGPKDMTLGSSYVAFTRVKELKNLIIRKLYSLDRLNSIVKSKYFGALQTLIESFGT